MLVERISTADAPAPLGHPARRPSDRPSTGPAIGERLPDFSLPDSQARRLRSWKEIGSGFLSLCSGDPCWTQLGELRDAFGKFSAHDINVYAISYDDQETLQNLPKIKISFPLLSDIDSTVVRQFGILNQQVQKTMGCYTEFVSGRLCDRRKRDRGSKIFSRLL